MSRSAEETAGPGRSPGPGPVTSPDPKVVPAQSSGSIAVEVRGKVLLGRIHAGPNAEIDAGVVYDLADLVTRADATPSVRGVVLTGVHDDRFLSHSALASPGPEVDSDPTDLPHPRLGLFGDVLLQMNTSGVVFVAALNGSALGAGCELALACDYRAMSRGAHLIGLPEILLGAMPGNGGTQRLTRLIGAGPALRQLLHGGGLTPADALACGVVDEISPPDRLLADALRWATHYGARDKSAVAAIKRAVYLGGSQELPDGLDLERVAHQELITTARAQHLARLYRTSAETHHELPFHRPDLYTTAVESGSLPATPF